MIENRRLRRFGVLAVATGAGLLGCGNRGDEWSTPFGAEQLVALEGSIALHDENLERVLFVTAPSDDEVAVQAFPLGRDVQAFLPSNDKKSLFVLSAGKVPRTQPDDERPQLQVFPGGTEPGKPRVYQLDDPMGQLALDPEGEWVAAFAGAATVVNVNEILLLDLQDKDAKPVPKSIRSFGGRPLELVFSPPLQVPGGERRFVAVRTDRDLTLIDLSDLERPEITVKMPEDENHKARVPAQVIFDDGDPDRDDDARIGVRLENTADVVVLQLGVSLGDEQPFEVVPNAIDVGGVPSTIDFVRTDGGLRLAALVPSRQRATLVNPDTTLTEVVELGGAYTQMTRITGEVGQLPENGDVALLWGAGQRFAFWSLGSASGTPYRSIDTTELDIEVSTVVDVPAPHRHLKVLVGENASSFYVLDLAQRESFPLVTSGSGFRVEASPDGQRLWAYTPGRGGFSLVRLDDLHPIQLDVSPAPTLVLDIARGDGGRAALALRVDDGLSATLLDANAPDSAKTRFFPALELGDLQ